MPEFDRRQGPKNEAMPAPSDTGPSIERGQLQRELSPPSARLDDPLISPTHPLYRAAAQQERYEGLPLKPSPLPSDRPTLKEMIVQREQDVAEFTARIQSGQIKGFPPEVVAAGERSVQSLVRRCLNEPDFQRRLLQEGLRIEEPSTPEINPRRPQNVVMSIGGPLNTVGRLINEANQERYGPRAPFTGVVQLGDNTYSVSIPGMGIVDQKVTLGGARATQEASPLLAGGISKPEPGRLVFAQAMSELVSNTEQWAGQNPNQLERMGARRDGLISEWELKGANTEAKAQVQILHKILQGKEPGEVAIPASRDLPEVFRRKLQEMGLPSERPVSFEEAHQLKENLTRFTKLADYLLAKDPNGGGSRFDTLAKMKMENPFVSDPQLKAPGVTPEGQVMRQPSSLLFGENKDDIIEAIDKNSPTVRSVINFTNRAMR